MKQLLQHFGCPQRIMRFHFKGLFVAIVTIALAGFGVRLFAAWSSSQGRSVIKPQQVQVLQEERLTALRRIVELVDQRYHSGSASRVELAAANRNVAEAELDMCATQKERVTVLGKMVDNATILETQAAELARKGVASEEAALVIKADLLQLRIRLEEAQAELARELNGCD